MARSRHLLWRFLIGNVSFKAEIPSKHPPNPKAAGIQIKGGSVLRPESFINIADPTKRYYSPPQLLSSFVLEDDSHQNRD